MPEINTAGSPGAANGTPGAIATQQQPQAEQTARGRIVSQTVREIPKDGESRRVTYFSLDTEPDRTYAAFGFTSFDPTEIPNGTEVGIVYTDWLGQDRWGRPLTYHNLRAKPTVLAPAQPQQAAGPFPEIDQAFGPEPTPAAAPSAPPPYRVVDKDNEVELTCSCLRKAKRHLDALRSGGKAITETDAAGMETWLDKLGLIVDGLRAVPAR